MYRVILAENEVKYFFIFFCMQSAFDSSSFLKQKVNFFISLNESVPLVYAYSHKCSEMTSFFIFYFFLYFVLRLILKLKSSFS